MPNALRRVYSHQKKSWRHKFTQQQKIVPVPFVIDPTMLLISVVTLIGLLKPLLVQCQPGIIGALHQLDRQENAVVGKDTAVCSSGGNLISDLSCHDKADFVSDKNQEEEVDPMLEEMPGFNFKAYKRADISSFYNEPPGSRMEATPSFNGQASKFQNMANERLDLYWDAGRGPPGQFICPTGPFESCGTSGFPSHVFFFVRPSTSEVVCSFSVRKGHSVYYCDPFSPNNPADPSAGVLSEAVRSVETLNQDEKALYESAVFNREFAPIYKNFTGGSEWLGKFPTEKPRHHIWRADYFGQQHTVQSKETQFLELPPESLLGLLSLEDMKRVNASTTVPLSDYRSCKDMNITLTVVSVAPRILQIDNFLSDVEVDHILDLASKRNLQRSTTGSGASDSAVSDTRTSRTTWLPRHSSPIMDAIIRRAADALKVDEALMRSRSKDEMPEVPFHGAINEELQIVHYSQGQQYTAHHDFGYPDTKPNSPSRSINFCMYLNEGMVGGETAFPRWRNAETDDAIKAVPKRGKAMIFYMKLPDGNLDDLSQHAAMPVIEGEKWFANLWSWDPERK